MRPEHATQNPWKARNFDQLLHQTWDSETFVFHPGSGHTHVLNDAAFALLDRLAVHPAATSDLAEGFTTDTPERRTALRKQLQQLEVVGLICRTRPPP
jgi:PqqD family protein of HPr-rel-A system